MSELVDFSELKNKTILKIDGCYKGSESILFYTSDGSIYRLKYHQDCCASCSVEDVIGEVVDLLNTPILISDEECNSDGHPEDIENQYTDESYTWTFYKLSTIKGSVTLRWYGASNGYYSESATFERIK